MPPAERGYYVSPPGGIDLAAFPKDAWRAEAQEPEPVARFAVLLGAVERIDLLEVAMVPHRRFLFERARGASWSKKAITP
jgi:hypothetical protein